MPLCLTLTMQGCVVWEIRDGIRDSNYQVAEANRRVGEATAQVDQASQRVAEASGNITRANVAIETANVKIDAANARIDSAESRIASTEKRIGSTEQQLVEVEGIIDNRIKQVDKLVGEVKPDLDRLHPIGGSLQHIDAHLRSVRKSIASINDQIPFVEIDADPLDSVPPPNAIPQADGQGVAPATGGTPEPAPAPATAQGAPEAAPTAAPASAPAAKRELLLGTWLREHPSKGVALIVLEDGTYILDANGPDSERGKWKRDGDNAVVFTPTTLAPAPPAAPGQPAPPAQPRPERRYTIVGRPQRVMTLDGGNAGILVYTRP